MSEQIAAVACTAPGYDYTTGEEIGTCGSRVLSPRGIEAARNLAVHLGWTLEPEPLCPRPHIHPDDRPVLILTFP